jgi:glycosyltransferase involved in cell wall biosynthesis
MESHTVEIVKPKILLVPDSNGWAFSNICGQIEKHLSNYYDFTTIAVNELDHFGQLLLLAPGHDLVHVFYRPHLYMLLDMHQEAYAHGIGFESIQGFFEKLLSSRITTAIYDHLFLDEDIRYMYEILLGNFVDGYYTCSEKLARIYNDLFPASSPRETIQDGVDTSLFRPYNLGRLEETKRPLVVGWVGNSRWAAEREDFKGLHSIVKPAIAQLQAEGLNLDSRFADREIAFIPHVAMPDYYASIDVLLCASKIEGTPNPVLEAMACGVPVISTDVGIVPEAFGPLQSTLILPERSIDELKTALRSLYKSRDLLPRLSAENLGRVKAWDWSLRVQKFRHFFDDVLAKPARPKQRLLTR